MSKLQGLFASVAVVLAPASVAIVMEPAPVAVILAQAPKSFTFAVGPSLAAMIPGPDAVGLEQRPAAAMAPAPFTTMLAPTLDSWRKLLPIWWLNSLVQLQIAKDGLHYITPEVVYGSDPKPGLTLHKQGRERPAMGSLD
ncbi:hypothetical protein AKJ16_DCAP13815 [Drosera capensis]